MKTIALSLCTLAIALGSTQAQATKLNFERSADFVQGNQRQYLQFQGTLERKKSRLLKDFTGINPFIITFIRIEQNGTLKTAYDVELVQSTTTSAIKPGIVAFAARLKSGSSETLSFSSATGIIIDPKVTDPAVGGGTAVPALHINIRGPGPAELVKSDIRYTIVGYLKK